MFLTVDGRGEGLYTVSLYSGHHGSGGGDIYRKRWPRRLALNTSSEWADQESGGWFHARGFHGLGRIIHDGGPI